MSGAERRAFRIHHQNRIARYRLAAVDHVTGEDPRVAGSNTIGSFSIDANSSQPSVYSRLAHGLEACNAIFRRWVSREHPHHALA